MFRVRDLGFRVGGEGTLILHVAKVSRPFRHVWLAAGWPDTAGI